MKMTDRELRRKSVELRRVVLKSIYHAGAGHTGGSLSCTDILNVLYNRVLRIDPANPRDPARDRYIQSKGHSAEALFAVLADRGFYDVSKLDSLCKFQSHFVGHPTRKVPGVEFNTGALGHGLAIGVGCAMAAKKDNTDFRTYVLLGDGELAEGSNWEAAMCGAHYALDNLVAIIDHNTLQITGRTRDVCNNEPLDEKWHSFGWEVRTVDGHSFPELTEALLRPSKHQPVCVIANTTKGRGVSFMEDVGKWHHGVPNEQELEQALAELGRALAVDQTEVHS